MISFPPEKTHNKEKDGSTCETNKLNKEQYHKEHEHKEHKEKKKYQKWCNKRNKYLTYKVKETWFDEEKNMIKLVRETEHSIIEKHYNNGLLHRENEKPAYIKVDKRTGKTISYVYNHGSRISTSIVSDRRNLVQK